MAFDTTGNVCFYFRKCFLVGWNTVIGGALGANASVGTGFLCSGKTISHGGYFFVALGGAIQGQVRCSERGGIKAGRGFGGVGAGAGLGYIGCETTYECLLTTPANASDETQADSPSREIPSGYSCWLRHWDCRRGLGTPRLLVSRSNTHSGGSEHRSYLRFRVYH